MSLEWQEDLATGIDNIDAQHKEIFARFTLFSDACSNGKADEELKNLLDFLVGYTAKHFREEEEAMENAHYPQRASQAEAHVSFMDDFKRLKESVEMNGPSLETILIEKRTMIRWLINHINHMDKEFAVFLGSTLLKPAIPHPD